MGRAGTEAGPDGGTGRDHLEDVVIDGHARLRLRCPCGRNLADVSWSDDDPGWTSDKLTVTPRPDVRQDDWRPWHEAEDRKRPTPAPPDLLRRLRALVAPSRARTGDSDAIAVAAPTPDPVRPLGSGRSDPRQWLPARPELFDADGERIGDAADWHHRTYTWHCRCGRTHSRRHPRLCGVWAEWAGELPNGRPRVVVLGEHF